MKEEVNDKCESKTKLINTSFLSTKRHAGHEIYEMLCHIRC